MKNVMITLCLVLSFNALVAQYQLIPTTNNSVSQTAVHTNDGGLLLAALEFCFTPGVILIHGCVNGVHLIRTDAAGDTLWTNVLGRSSIYSPEFNIFENQDGSFTFIQVNNQTYQCDGVGVGLNGFRQIEILQIDANGQLVEETRFPDNCELVMHDAIRIDDNRYAVSTYYRSPISINFEPEGRLFLMTNSGFILAEHRFPNERLEGSFLTMTSNDEIALLYADEARDLQLHYFDNQLNLLSTHSYTDLEGTCLDNFETNYRIKTNQFRNGNFGILCNEFRFDFENTQLYRFDQTLNLLSTSVTSLNRPTNLQESEDGTIVFASTVETSSLETDVQVNFFSASCDSLSARILTHPENEEPRHILIDEDNRLMITGSANCCNIDMTTGPSNTFLLFEELNLIPDNTNNFLNSSDDISVYPNPVNNRLNIRIKEGQVIGQPLKIVIYSTLGVPVIMRDLESEYTRILVNSLYPGTYFYTIYSGQYPLQQGKFTKL